MLIGASVYSTSGSWYSLGKKCVNTFLRIRKIFFARLSRVALASDEPHDDERSD